jgi:uncharacterized protein (DUF1697 family)
VGGEVGTFVALLRGINVGGKNVLPMKDLVAIFDRAGCVDVRHYIQSGNVVFGATARQGGSIARVVAERIEKDHGLKVPVVVRTASEMTAVVRANPYLPSAANPGQAGRNMTTSQAADPLRGVRPTSDPKQLHVMFLAHEPEKKRASALDQQRSPPDAFELRGREVFLLLPNGAARTKLTNAYFDSTLATTSTLRNWNTVLKLAEMCGS